MEYQVFDPQEKLSPYLKCYWNLDNDEDSAPHSRERIFPDGCIELIFNYADLMQKFENGKAEIQQRHFIHGQLKKFMELESTGKVGIFSVRFQPAGLQPFIDFDVSQLTEKTMTVAEIWGDSGSDFEKQMQAAQTISDRIATTENFLLHRLAQSRKNDPAISLCVGAIVATSGRATIEELSEQFHIGKRHLERKFLATVGLSQKLFSRIIRFNHALQLIENKDFSTFTHVAHEGGFYDQAHFIRDFKAFTGLNPKQYFSENLEMVKFFNL